MTARETISRSDLYDLVWSKPISQLAKSYSLSDVGLAKLCHRYDIPRPGRGYWAKLQHGKKVRRTPLPNRADERQIRLAEAGPSAPSSSVRESAEARIHAEKNPENRITVHPLNEDTPRHKLVEKAEKQLIDARVDHAGRICARKNPTLDITTTKSNLPRILSIMNALLVALEERGYKVSRGPAVEILGSHLGISVSEDVETVQTPRDDLDISGGYEFGHSRHTESQRATGSIVMYIEGGEECGGYGCQRSWRDTKKQPLERRVNAFIAAMIEFAIRIHERDEQRRKAEEERQQADILRAERAKQRAERQKEYNAEKKRLETLLSQASSLQQCKQIRELIEAVRLEHSRDAPIDPDSEIGRWIQWASLHADRFDPIIES